MSAAVARLGGVLRGVLLVSAVTVLALGATSARATGESTPAQIKAALLYKFAKFTEWPESAFDDDEDPLVFAVLGEDTLGSALDDAVEGREAHGRNIEVKRFAELEDLEDCHVLFVAPSHGDDVEAVVKALDERAVLLVGGTARFAHRGGVANFYARGASIRFEINTDAAKRFDLEISAQLLKLARIIRD